MIQKCSPRLMCFNIFCPAVALFVEVWNTGKVSLTEMGCWKFGFYNVHDHVQLFPILGPLRCKQKHSKLLPPCTGRPPPPCQNKLPSIKFLLSGILSKWQEKRAMWERKSQILYRLFNIMDTLNDWSTNHSSDFRVKGGCICFKLIRLQLVVTLLANTFKLNLRERRLVLQCKWE